MKRIILTNDNTDSVIEDAVTALESGELIIFPTETCYGVGGDATNLDSVQKVLKYKSRREGKPLSIAVANKEMASKYVEINDIADNLYENYLPGPITVVSKSLGNVATGVESEFGTIGIRIPKYQLILDILTKFNKPFTSTSANVSYQSTPYDIDSLLEKLPTKQKNMIGLIIDAGHLPHNPPSTVVDTTLNNLNVMREGSELFDLDISENNVVLKANTAKFEDTIDFGGLTMLKYIDTVIDQPLILALRGELGAGKTQFVKGIAMKLGIKEDISSPTYTIIDEYKYKLGEHRNGFLIHMDTWRVDGSDEFLRTGICEYLIKGNIVAIEWADKFYKDLLELSIESGAKLLKVDFEYLSEVEREVVVIE
jgi:L-threonylcarbamoyladenylate synthase